MNDIDTDGFATQQTTTTATSGTGAGVKNRTTITMTQAQADSIAAGDTYRLRLERVNGGGGNMSGDAEVLRVIVRQ